MFSYLPWELEWSLWILLLKHPVYLLLEVIRKYYLPPKQPKRKIDIVLDFKAQMGNIELIGKEIRESVGCRVAEREDKQVERCT